MKTIKKSMNGEDFKKFVQEQLVPKLWKGAVLVMDNLKAHKVEGVEKMIEAVGARVVYLSPYSPEFNPIEHLWWELKAWLRRFVPRSVQILEKLLELGVKLCSSKQIENYFAHCCYCTSYSRKVLYREAIANPAKYGLTNVRNACLSGAEVCESPKRFLFWDGIHPTTAV